MNRQLMRPTIPGELYRWPCGEVPQPIRDNFSWAVIERIRDEAETCTISSVGRTGP